MEADSDGPTVGRGTGCLFRTGCALFLTITLFTCMVWGALQVLGVLGLN